MERRRAGQNPFALISRHSGDKPASAVTVEIAVGTTAWLRQVRIGADACLALFEG